MTTYQPDAADPEGRCTHCGQPPHLHDLWLSCDDGSTYSVDGLVLVRFPLPGQDSDPETWPWLPGIITADGGEDEWQVVVLDERLEQNGTYPLCYRDARELRPRPAR